MSRYLTEVTVHPNKPHVFGRVACSIKIVATSARDNVGAFVIIGISMSSHWVEAITSISNILIDSTISVGSNNSCISTID